MLKETKTGNQNRCFLNCCYNSIIFVFLEQKIAFFYYKREKKP